MILVFLMLSFKLAFLLSSFTLIKRPFFFLKKTLLLFSLLSHVWVFETSGTVARQASLSMGFPSQEYWSGLKIIYKVL